MKNKSSNKYNYNYKIELFLILIVSTLIYFVAHYYDLYEKFDSFLKKYEYLNIDELFFTGIFVLCGLGLFAIRRYLELKKEIVFSTIAKNKLQKEVIECFHAETALINSEEKYRILIDQSAEAIYLYEDGKFEIVNNKFIELLGYSLEEIYSPDFSVLEFTHPKSIPFMEERIRKVRAGEKVPSLYEFTAIMKDKKEIELEASISYVKTNGRLKIQGILRDISKRKQAESVQSAIYSISEAANTASNLDELLASIHTILKSIMYAENFFVALYDDKTDTYTSPYFVDQFDKLDGKPMHMQGSLTDYVRRTESPIIISDKKHAELVETGEAAYILKPAKVWMGAPLKTAAGVFGVIAVQSYESSDLYSSEHLEILRLISGQIAIAIEKKKASDEKEKNRKFFETVIDTLANPLFVINVDDYLVAVANRAAKELIFANNPIDWKCYKPISDERKKCNCSDSTCPMTKLIQNKKPVTFEQKVMQEDGTELIYEVFAFPIFDEHGKVFQIIENLVDITERKRVENKLTELAVFPEANPNIVLRINSKQEITYMNSATSMILGEVGVLRENMKLCLPKNLTELCETMLTDGGDIQDVHVKINKHTLSWSFHPIVGKDIIHCYGHDITKEVEQAEKINKLSMVATQSSNIIMITDIQGIVEYVNPYFTYVTGFAKDEVVGEKLAIIKSGTMKEELYEELWHSITHGITWNGKIENKKKNGEFYWESKTISPIFSDDGEITSYISIGTDITNEIYMQRQLVESEKFSAIATLAAGVAHEFKNYLGGIIGNASFTLDELDSKDGLSLARETLEKIIDMGEKANDVAMSLLTFSKAKSDDRKKENLKKIITQSIKLIEKELNTLSIEIALHFDDVHPVEVSLSKIQQLLLNLFINAKHAIGTNGVITIALLNKGDMVEIRIGDSGGGIDVDNLDKIFDPFFSTKGVWGEDNVSGTGMGLSICRNIAREHNGDLTVNTILNVGSVFTISLPISKYPNFIIPYLTNSKEQNIILFTLNHALVTHYYDDVCKYQLQLLLVDNFNKINKELLNKTEYVVCDARFAAKLELYRMVEYCIENNQPYVMVNCGTMEYQLSELYENSIANYKELPDFYKLMNDFNSVSSVNKSQQKI